MRNPTGKLLVLAAAVLLALFFAFDLQRYLTLDYLKASREQFEQLYESSPVLVMGSYFLIYVATTALSLPGATILTLAGGALFGLLAGTVIVSFTSTLGATLAMLLARFLLQNWVQSRFGEHLQTINSGIEKEGGFYLFTLRLVPAVPFFVINLGMGLTPIRAITFYWVSQLGMLPGTLVYVNAGSELGKLETLGDILSPTLIGSFVLLGVFPLLVKKLVSVIQNRRQANPSSSNV
ncbi:MAG TPA: TVP38/TMEM64 family protein [Deltaproteobacteria bacterium]|nr:TVP38/TMEM64 family protein [Deltaproteobacteria bacterium]